MKQRPLHLAGRPELTFATLVVGDSNRAALTCLKAFPDWPAPVLLLLGPSGSGKTHIGKATETKFGTPLIDAADTVAEPELFALINKALSGEIPGLVMASRLPPTDWNTQTPDLVSRLANVPVFRLEEPGDDILGPVLANLFHDQGRTVGRDVVDYILSRCARSVPELERLVERIETEAQSERADVTKTWVSRYLARQRGLSSA